MLNIYKKILYFLAFLFMSNANYAFVSNNNTIENFISISDIHFDPFYGCKKSHAPCQLILELKTSESKDWHNIFERYNTNTNIKFLKETNYNLLKLTMIELKNISNKNSPNFVLILGDLLAHQFKSKYRKYSQDLSQSGYEIFVRKVMEFLALELNNVFPNTNIYSVIGNHDSYISNYKVVPNGKFINEIGDIWASLIKTKTQKKEFLQVFKKSGYYSISLGNNSKLIVLNTVMFSPNSQNKVIKQAANIQLNWFKKQLQTAQEKNEKLLIAGHIPISLDLDLTIIMPHKIFKTFWKKNYTNKFIELVNTYSNQIIAFLSGHIHIDHFQFSVPNIQDKYIPIIITPSISPSYGSSPAIKQFIYSPKNLELIKFNRYFLPLTGESQTWQESSQFNGIFTNNCLKCYLKDIITYLIMNNYVFNFLKKTYTIVDSKNIEEKGDITYFWCTIYSPDLKSYKKCIADK